jgi:DNA modification methylase
MTWLPITRALQQIASKLPLDAKRITSRNEGVESWYPYYAGFSDRFARLILESVDLPPRATVIDPRNGSGTTTHVADQLGHTALGFDLNPIAALVARAHLITAAA